MQTAVVLSTVRWERPSLSSCSFWNDVQSVVLCILGEAQLVTLFALGGTQLVDKFKLFILV